jgi:hypothetical protein
MSANWREPLQIEGLYMRNLVLALAFLAIAPSAQAQSAVPDLKGTWVGKGKSLIYGNSTYHPGSEPPSSPPRVREIEITHVVDGQDGRLAWGRTSSSNAAINEPFAWAIAADNKTVVGSDSDGYFLLTLLSGDRMDKCYVHSGISPSKSTVATCFEMVRTKK